MVFRSLRRAQSNCSPSARTSSVLISRPLEGGLKTYKLTSTRSQHSLALAFIGLASSKRSLCVATALTTWSLGKQGKENLTTVELSATGCRYCKSYKNVHLRRTHDCSVLISLDKRQNVELKTTLILC